MNVAHIFISGIIGEPDFFDVSASEGNTLADVRRQLNSYDSPHEAVFHINSVGGEVNEGLAIYDFISSLNIPTTTIIESKAFSIASAIALAGDKRFAMQHAEILIHNPWVGFAAGDADDMERMASELRKKEEILLDLYTEKTGQAREKLADWMNAETFLTAKEAIEAGFIHEIRESIEARLKTAFNKPVRAVAFIKLHKTDMTDQEVKKAKGLFSDLANLFNRFKNEAPEQPTPEPETPAPNEGPDWEAEKAELIGQIETLKAEISKKEASAEEAKTELEAAQAKLTEQTKVVAQIQARVKELEAMPIVQQKAVENEVVTKQAATPHHLDGFAQALAKKYGGAKR